MGERRLEELSRVPSLTDGGKMSVVRGSAGWPDGNADATNGRRAVQYYCNLFMDPGFSDSVSRDSSVPRASSC